MGEKKNLVKNSRSKFCHGPKKGRVGPKASLQSEQPAPNIFGVQSPGKSHLRRTKATALGGVTSICGHTWMCHFLGYLLGFCPRFMGILSKTLPDLWVYILQYHMRFMGPNFIRKWHTPVTITYKLPPRATAPLEKAPRWQHPPKGES